MSEEIVLTESAAKKVAALAAEEGNTDPKLRVFVQGGGCSGMEYGFTFEQTINEDDITSVYHGVTLVIDPISQQYLLGAEIDYKDDKLNGSRFIIRNPNVQHTCGCGNSFS